MVVIDPLAFLIATDSRTSRPGAVRPRPRRGLWLAALAVGALFAGAQAGLAQSSAASRGLPSRLDFARAVTVRTAMSRTLKVPGATLYYEVRGSGPTLLMIPGGPQDAGVFADVGRQLSDHYTVVAYDPRGNSRSTLDAVPADQQLDVHGDDAAALIEAIGGGPAYVFGTSGGAQIGLNLAARHPGRVRTLVAHEPPAVLMLDDPSEALAADRAIHDTYRREGVDAAMAKFFAMSGLDAGAEPHPEAPPRELPPETAETMARVGGNFEYWLAHGLLPLSLYRPEIDALRAGQPRVVIGIGEGSAGQPIQEMSMAVADKLGAEPITFPGDHVGFMTHANIFAETLQQVFTEE